MIFRCLFVLCVLLPYTVSYLDGLGKEHREVWNKVLKGSMQEGENFYEFVNRVTGGKMFNVSLEAHALLEKQGRRRPPVDTHFNCVVNNKPKHKAKNVHELTPYDVDVIAAFGDSLTAGFGASAYTPIDLFIEYHGVSWSIGGDETVRTVITLPNILREYNTNLTGFATGISPPLIAIPSEHLDVAVSGSTSYGLMKQAKRFIEKMLTKPEYDFFGSWKVLTLFIGGNDLCSCCRWWKNDREKYSPGNFISEVKDVLDYLHQRVPKLFVNLVTPPNVTILQDLASPWCDFTHLLECKCGTVYGQKARDYTNSVLRQYVKGYEDLINTGKYDTRDDFTVVLQPFFDNTIVPRDPDGKVNRTFFAPDCFHFSDNSHAASALALWNAMLEPVGNKSKTWRKGEEFHCPSKEHPYFYTRLNSGKHYQPVSMATEGTTKQDGGGSKKIVLVDVDPFMLLLIAAMVLLFVYTTVSYLLGGLKKPAPALSVSSSGEKQRPNPDMFFNSEIKEMR